MTHLRRLYDRLRTHRPFITTRADHASSLRRRQFLQQQQVALLEQQADYLRTQVELLRSLHAAALRDQRRVERERDQALDEVSRLRKEAAEQSHAMRAWIERTVEPRICHN